MQLALTTAHRWCTTEGLSINPKKTTLVAFTRRLKYKLKAPVMAGQELVLTNSIKYLGVVFDQKLTWSLHLEQVINKARTALFLSSRMAGKKWGLKPKILDWIYKSIVRPIISYAAIIWWPRIELKVGENALNKLQRTACLAITGATTSCPTAAMQVLLNLPPLPMYIESEAAKWALRIKSSGNLKPGDLTGHLSILNRCKFPIDEITDSMPTTFSFQRNFSVVVESRERWTKGEVNFPRGSLVFYTDGSKMDNGDTGAGVCGPRLKLALPMGSYPTVFQAEIYAIQTCVSHCLKRKYQHAKIFIVSDSKASLLALEAKTFTSRLVWECMQTLNMLAVINKVTLMWVPGHSGIEGNEAADQLAKEGGAIPFVGPEPFCAFPRSHQMAAIRLWEDSRKRASWEKMAGQRQAKAFLTHSKTYTDKVLQLSKPDLCTLTGILTGHCPVKYHLKNLRKVPEDTCRFCKEESETSEHLLCKCPALSKGRLDALSSRFLEPSEICKIAPGKVAVHRGLAA
jgi:ribonuclease HI